MIESHRSVIETALNFSEICAHFNVKRGNKDKTWQIYVCNKMYCYVALKRLVFVVCLQSILVISIAIAILQLSHIHDTCKQKNLQCKQ